MMKFIRHIKVVLINPKDETRVFENVNSKGFRIDFRVNKFAGLDGFGIGDAEVILYNLNEESKNFINILNKDGYNKIVISAGYGDKEADLKTIFTGYINSFYSTKQAPDIITRLFCYSIIQKSFRQRYTIQETLTAYQLFDKITNQLGIRLDIPDINLRNKLKQKRIGGRTYNLGQLDAIKTICSLLEPQLNFYIDFEKLILSELSVDDKSKSLIISPKNGLLGLPEITEEGCNVRMLLNPEISPLTKFKLESDYANINLSAMGLSQRVANDIIGSLQRVNGYNIEYYGISLDHTGSSHTDTWETNVKAILPVDRSV